MTHPRLTAAIALALVAVAVATLLAPDMMPVTDRLTQVVVV